MAIVLTIDNKDTKETVRKKLEEFNKKASEKKGFPAIKFTGKVKSYGDGVGYQRRIRDEWD